MGGDAFTPGKAAIKLTHWLDALEVTGLPRFPVGVEQLTLEVGRQLQWPDPISVVQPAAIKSFEGGLFKLDETSWALLYNETLSSLGRIRFTQAHELGHYLVHRLGREKFECSQSDVVHGASDDGVIEAEADEFATNLLMPMKQFRAATASSDGVDFDILADAAALFGVSLTSAALRWIQTTQDSAVLILSRDGFIDWSVSTERARVNERLLQNKESGGGTPDGHLGRRFGYCNVPSRAASSAWCMVRARASRCRGDRDEAALRQLRLHAVPLAFVARGQGVGSARLGSPSVRRYPLPSTSNPMAARRRSRI